jgi:hypothetical protein
MNELVAWPPQGPNNAKDFSSGPDSGKPLEDTSSRSMTDFLGTSDGLELVRAFMAVKDAKVRRPIVNLTKAAAAHEE